MTGRTPSQTQGAGRHPAAPVTAAGEHAPARTGPAVPPAPAPARGWLPAAVGISVLAMLASLLAAGGAPDPVAPGLPDPGVLTAWGLPVARLLFDASFVALLGALVTAVLLPADGYAQDSRSALRAAGWSAAAWAVCAAALLLLTVSDVLGVPVHRVFSSGELSTAVWQLTSGRGLLLAVACGVVLTAYTRWVRTRGEVGALLVVGVSGLLPVLFAGHSSAASDHDLATSSLIVHVLAASVWVGGLAGVLLLLRGRHETLGAVLPRYSNLALVCFAAVALSGLLNAWVRTSGDLGLWAGSGYGALLAVKISALLALGFFGWTHRRRTVEAVVSGRRGAFARLATVEVLLMALTVGVAVALSRTPPPAGATAEVPAHGAGHPTLGDDVAPFSATRLLTEWRPDAITLLLIAVLVAAYVAGVRRLHGRGESWSWARSASAGAAAVIALVATSGGLATYSTAAFSLQVAQFLVLLVVVPVLVALSAPVTLLLRSLRPPADREARGVAAELPAPMRSRPLAWLLDPLNMLIVVTVMVFVLYATPLLEASLRSVPLHLGTNLVTLLAGCLLWWSLLAVDPVPPPRPSSYRLWVLVGFVVLLGGIAARIYLSEVILAGTWFVELDWPWVSIPGDQQRGALIMGGTVAVLAPFLAVLIRYRPAAVRSGPWRQDS
jgi:cytochrome c oxidase assembly factor CtaG/putative copper export protein